MFPEKTILLLLGMIGGCFLLNLDIGPKCNYTVTQSQDIILEKCVMEVLKFNISENYINEPLNLTKPELIDIGMCAADSVGILLHDKEEEYEDDSDKDFSQSMAEFMLENVADNMHATKAVKRLVTKGLDDCTDANQLPKAYFGCGMEVFVENCR